MLPLGHVTARQLPALCRVGAIAARARKGVRGESCFQYASIGTVPAATLQRPYDVVIIGGGPAGVTAGLKAAAWGRRALIIDKPKLPPLESGLDVSFGAPTGLFSKALRDTGKQLDVRSLRSMGLGDDVIYKQALNTCLQMAAMSAEYQVKLLSELKVSYLQAQADIVTSKQVRAKCTTGEEYLISTENLLIATGSRANRPSMIPFDDTRIFDSDTLNLSPYLPKSVVVIGSGIIAIEYAMIFRGLDAKVSMLSRGDVQDDFQRLGLDQDIGLKLFEVLRRSDVNIFEHTSVASYKVPASRSELVELQLDSSVANTPNSIECDLVLPAVGRLPNTVGFGLDNLKVALDSRGYIKVNGRFETSEQGIYAAGDVIGPPGLASTGKFQASRAIEAMFHAGYREQDFSYAVGVWTIPEVGYYGLTKEAAEKSGRLVEEGVAQYKQCLRGRVFAPDGQLKLVFDPKDGIILGVHIIGADACELVHYGMELVQRKATIYDLMGTVFTAVTFHELFVEAALNGNSKLEFGFQWQAILKELGSLVPDGTVDDESEVRRCFEEIDKNSNGALDASELKAVFNELGMDVAPRTVVNLIRLVDEDKSGTLQLNEFMKLYKVLNVYRTARDGGENAETDHID